jgi:predicted nucleic acid-binding protein
MATIKVLFFDTNALIKLFLPDEPGASTVKWLIDARVKIPNSLVFCISKSVVFEFKKKISEFESNGKIDQNKAQQIRDKFDRDYLDRWFRIVEPKRSATRPRSLTLTEVFRQTRSRMYSDNRDVSILYAIENALGGLGGLSHPILITSDTRFAKRAKKLGYRTINPAKRTSVEILKIIRGDS